MPEAIAQIRREASGLSEEIGTLSERATELRRQLEEQGPMIGAAARQLEDYRDRMSRGVHVGGGDLDNLRKIQEVLQLQGGDTGRQYLTTLARIDQARSGGRISRPLLDDERDAARARSKRPGQEGLDPAREAELDRARVVGDVIIHRPPKPRPGPQPPAPTDRPDEPAVDTLPDIDMPPRPVEQPGPQPAERRADSNTPAAELPNVEPELQRPEPHTGPQPPEPRPGPQPSEPGPIDRDQLPRPVPKPGPQPTAPGPGTPRDSGEPLDADSAQASRQQGADDGVMAERRREFQVRASAKSERELQREWRESGRLMNQQLGDLRRAEDQIRKYATARKALTADQEQIFKDLKDQLPGLRHEVLDSSLNRRAILDEALSRGMVQDGNNLTIPRRPPPQPPRPRPAPSRQSAGLDGPDGPGMFRQGVGGFMAGGGFGGGVGGAVAGAALGFLNWPRTLGTLAGLGVAYGRQQYSDHVQELMGFEQLGRMTGHDPDRMLMQNAGDMERFRVFDKSTTTQVAQIMGRMTGAPETTGPLATGAITGTDPVQEAMRVAQASQFMPHLGDARDMSLDTLAEFRRSAATRLGDSLVTSSHLGTIPGRFSAAELAEKRKEIEVLQKVLGESGDQDYPGRANWEGRLKQLRSDVAEGGDRRSRGPDFDPLLYSTFADSALRSYVGLSQHPFIPADQAGAAGMLGQATHTRVPGIDPMSHAGIKAAEARLQNVNAFTQPGGGLFQEMQMLGVMRLRGTETAEKLKAEGIDISSPLGVMRAMQRAPQLATQGVPEVQHAMLKSVAEMFPDRETRGMALTMQGMDPETAYRLSEDIALASRKSPEQWGPPKRTDEQRESDRQRLTDAGDVITHGSLASGAAGKIHQEVIRPQILDTVLGAGVGEEWGPEARSYLNEFKEAMVRGVVDILSEKIEVPDRAARE